MKPEEIPFWEFSKAVMYKESFDGSIEFYTLNDKFVRDLWGSIEKENEKLYYFLIDHRDFACVKRILNELSEADSIITEALDDYTGDTEMKDLIRSFRNAVNTAVEIIIHTVGHDMEIIFPQRYIDDYRHNERITYEFHKECNIIAMKAYNHENNKASHKADNDNIRDDAQGGVDEYESKTNKNISPIVKIYKCCVNAEHYTFKNIEFDLFSECIKQADFKKPFNMNGTNKSRLKHIIYLLSDIMGSQWYGDTVKSIGMTKQTCSKAVSRNVEWVKWINGCLGEKMRKIE
ncbi:hypothetical protein Barb4_02088 [Bacteroidales bacterium Barb4]|nr:hypothetical protein Barb4_02088 [Bacteroidales bacterium Barb4]